MRLGTWAVLSGCVMVAACSSFEDGSTPANGTGGFSGAGGATGRDGGTTKDGGSFPIGGAGGAAGGTAGTGATGGTAGTSGTAGTAGAGGSSSGCPATWSRDLPGVDIKGSAQSGNVVWVVGDKAGDSHITELSACDGSIIRQESNSFAQGYSTFVDVTVHSGSVLVAGSVGPPATSGVGLFGKIDLTTLKLAWSNTVTPASSPGAFSAISALSESSVWLFGAAANGPFGGTGNDQSACDIGLTGAGSAFSTATTGNSVYAAIHQDNSTTLRRYKSTDCAGCASCTDDWRSEELSTTGWTAARGLAVLGSVAFVAGTFETNASGFLSQIDLTNGQESAFFSEDTTAGLDGFMDVVATSGQVIVVGGTDYAAVGPPAGYRGVIYAFQLTAGQLPTAPTVTWKVDRSDLRLATTVVSDTQNGGVIVGGNTFDNVTDSFSGKVLKCTDAGQCPP